MPEQSSDVPCSCPLKMDAYIALEDRHCNFFCYNQNYGSILRPFILLPLEQQLSGQWKLLLISLSCFICTSIVCQCISFLLNYFLRLIKLFWLFLKQVFNFFLKIFYLQSLLYLLQQKFIIFYYKITVN